MSHHNEAEYTDAVATLTVLLEVLIRCGSPYTDIREQSLPRRTKSGVLAIGEGSIYGHYHRHVA
jgi:hypothetical protein